MAYASLNSHHRGGRCAIDATGYRCPNELSTLNMLKIGGQKVPTRTLLLVLCDGVMMLTGLLVGTALRFHNARSIYAYIQHPSTPYRVAWVVLTCVCALYYSDLYESRVLSHSRDM